MAEPALEKSVYRPVVTARVNYESATIVAQFLVDSGADFSILRKDVAQALGMPLSGGERREIHGINRVAVKCYARKVFLSMPVFERPFESIVYISKDLQPLYNLLGRDNFFIQYRVGFDQKERKLLLDDRQP